MFIFVAKKTEAECLIPTVPIYSSNIKLTFGTMQLSKDRYQRGNI